MGATQSTSTSASNSISEKAVIEQQAVESLAQKVADLAVADGPVSADGSLPLDLVKSWQESTQDVSVILSFLLLLTLLQDHKLRLARTILAHSNIKNAIASPHVVVSDAHVFSLTIPFATGPVTNQQSSGRCWLFATTVRVFVWHVAH